MRRRIVPITASVALLATAALSACTAADPASSCEPAFGEGALTSSVRVSGDSAEDVKITVSRGIQALGAQRSIVHTSSAPAGPVVEIGSIVQANIAFVDSSTGDVLSISNSFGGETADTPFVAGASPSSILQGVLCASAGDTVAIALTAQESASYGLDEGSTVVVVAQIVEVAPIRAEGSSRALPFGFPAVTTDETGRPGIVLPPQEAPSETRSALRIAGEGAEVTAEDRVVGQILTVGWDGEVERNTWDGGGPLDMSAEGEQDSATFRAELTGVPIGSQVVVIEPGDGGARVSVIDVLAVI